MSSILNSTKKIALFTVVTVTALIVVCFVTGCSSSGSSSTTSSTTASATTTIQRDGYSFESPSDWTWEDNSDTTLTCSPGGDKSGETIVLQEITVDQKVSSSALTSDDLHTYWFNDEEIGSIKQSYSEVEDFTVGTYDWVRGTETMEGSGHSTKGYKVVGSVSPSRYIVIDYSSYTGNEDLKHLDEFKQMVDSLRLS
ncbi:hypothetical protein Ccur_06400 [Cryptobacterium curtum DSM 15641]|uniref:Uncharacterized protein n=1 Tax=Cryptobacterium curtum (strain ATCC 700683 / DSM 15641 / CCUG 43107 / 12-3) TaxID=469378 RepID=C7MN65_CRYCD|nr:hypothetical protein [Cryptobacterium curtum]ACU94355.1 hypothetical protein Ccur_06400 [Cryptobacterium curtum DSM 15641]